MPIRSPNKVRETFAKTDNARYLRKNYAQINTRVPPAEKLEKPGPSIHVALMARVFFFFCSPTLWTKSEVTRVSKVVKLL
jgi:hypothetical protein